MSTENYISINPENALYLGFIFVSPNILKGFHVCLGCYCNEYAARAKQTASLSLK